MKAKLKDLFLFKDLDTEIIQEIENLSTELTLPKDSVVFYEGDESKNMFLLTKGIIKLYKVTSHDKEVILKYFHSNETIAEVANFENINYPATAQAFTDIEILKIDFEELKKIIHKNPALSYKIMTSLIKKIRNLENVISMHIVLDSQERVAKYIYDHTEDFFKTKNILVAEILNISPETLSRVLRTLKDENIINTSKKFVDKDALKSYFC
ncbi:MAG: Crp/Fnr family transcriptional regulator [Arcobacter sp.]|uniref:Crp/Fnr family transcriptional regulator n=1 Tax=Arcobacter sp. TaxID=1872629 RepID=UPI003AFFA3C6